MKANDLFAKRIQKQFTVLEVVRSIVGDTSVTTGPTSNNKHKFVTRQSNEPGFSPPSFVHDDWMKELGIGPSESPGTLYVPRLESRNAVHIAMAAHEACHAKMYLTAKGAIWRNEKLTNQLAARWLKKNLSGMRLHVALEAILQSKISYGVN